MSRLTRACSEVLVTTASAVCGTGSRASSTRTSRPASSVDDLSSAGWAGAAQAAAQAASNPQLSPIQVLTQALAGYSGAKQRAKSELRGEAREERLFGLKERQLAAEIKGQEGTAARLEREDVRKEGQLRAAAAAIEGLPEGPVKEQAKTLYAIGETDAIAKLLAPEKKNPIVFGNELRDPDTLAVLATKTEEPKVYGGETGGYFVLGPNGPVTVRPGIGREGSEVFGAAWSPDQVAKAGLPVGTIVQPSNRGGFKYNLPATGNVPQVAQLQAIRDGLALDDPRRNEVQKVIDKLGASGADSEPLESVVTPQGIRLLPRSQATGMQPAPKQEGGTGEERLDAELLRFANRARADGGFQNFSEQDKALYTRKFNRASEPRFDAAGNQITPLVQDLPVPPDMSAAWTASPVALPSPIPGGPPPAGLPMVGGAPGSSVLPPSPGLTYPPPGGISPVINTAANRTQIAKMKTARDALDAAVKNYKDLVKQTGGGKILSGPLGSAAATALDSARTQVLMGAKNVHELGALTGPDLPLMETQVPSATGLAGVFDATTRVDAGIDQLLKGVDANVMATEKAYGPPDQTGTNFSNMSKAEADKAYDKLPVGGTYTDTDGKTYTKTAK